MSKQITMRPEKRDPSSRDQISRNVGKNAFGVVGAIQNVMCRLSDFFLRGLYTLLGWIGWIGWIKGGISEVSRDPSSASSSKQDGSLQKTPRLRVVYVAGPFRGANSWAVEQNVRRAEHVAFEVAAAGGMPLCPHANTAHFDGTLTAEFWIEGTLELLRRCDAMVVVEGWENSSGTRGEIAEARRLGIPTFYDVDELSEWLAAHHTQEVFAELAGCAS